MIFPIPEVMIPLVSFLSEYRSQAAIVRRAAEEVFAAHQARLAAARPALE